MPSRKHGTSQHGVEARCNTRYGVCWANPTLGSATMRMYFFPDGTERYSIPPSNMDLAWSSGIVGRTARESVREWGRLVGVWLGSASENTPQLGAHVASLSGVKFLHPVCPVLTHALGPRRPVYGRGDLAGVGQLQPVQHAEELGEVAARGRRVEHRRAELLVLDEVDWQEQGLGRGFRRRVASRRPRWDRVGTTRGPSATPMAPGL